MTTHESDRIYVLFGRALELEVDARETFVLSACGDDRKLLGELRSLLARHEELEGVTVRRNPFVEEVGHSAEAILGPSALIGRSIGAYTILDVLGTGGMGEVYLARQRDPPRDVALKIIRRGIVSKETTRRFRFETELLGRLNHPGIAQIFEAGIHEDRHFFAMEWVDGCPITEHADRRRFDTRQRLRLLSAVCDGVQHAHQKGIIHRDLKPANILVDATGQPRILDFGVAVATDADIRSATGHTSMGDLIGTLSYMAPEQAGGRIDEIDTRADVYTLGVIAYELLAGRLPHDLASLSLPDAVRSILAQEPPRLGQIDRAFRGDIETIVATALAKDRGRRYQSAADLAADIERHLNHQPLAARPPSTLYHLGKFARRNKILVAAVAAIFVVLVAGIAVSSVFFILERNQREIVTETLDFVTEDLLAPAAPNDLGPDTKVGELLDRASAALEGRFEGHPQARAEIHAILGNTYRRLGEYGRARRHLSAAMDIQRGELGERDPVTLHTINELAAVFNLLDDLEEAIRLYGLALEGRRIVLGENHRDTFVTKNDLALVYSKMGDYKKAAALFAEVLNAFDEDDPEWLTALNNLASVRFRQGREAEKAGREDEAREYYETTERLHRRVLEARRSILGEDDVKTMISRHNLGGVLSKLGRYQEAEPLNARAVGWAQRQGSGYLPYFLVYYGRCLTGMGDHARAIPFLRDALDLLADREPHDEFVQEARELLAIIEAGRGGPPRAEE